MKTVGIIGAGAWGTAVATLLAENGYRVTLWSHEIDVANTINSTKINAKYLPGIILSDHIQAVTDLTQATCGSQWIFLAVPVKFLRSVLESARHCYSEDQVWVVLSKGIEQKTLMLPTQIIDDVFGTSAKKAVFSGPSFAIELAKKQITAVTLAATDCTIGLELQKILANKYFRPYISLDIIGAQVGGALKNVLTLGVGMLDGAGYSDNVKAFLITRGLHEIVQLTTFWGGRAQTMYGLSGVGDLVLTSMGQSSKNLAVGKRLGRGETMSIIAQEMNTLPEGINTVQSVYELIQAKKLDLPICQGLYHVIFNDKNIHEFLAELMARPLEAECEM